MIPDSLDIFIFKTIFDAYKIKKDVTNWDISKRYALSINPKSNVDDFNKIFVRIKARIKNYCVKGIFTEALNGNGEKIYEMNLEKITFIKHKFCDGFKECLIIRIT